MTDASPGTRCKSAFRKYAANRVVSHHIARRLHPKSDAWPTSSWRRPAAGKYSTGEKRRGGIRTEIALRIILALQWWSRRLHDSGGCVGSRTKNEQYQRQRAQERRRELCLRYC